MLPHGTLRIEVAGKPGTKGSTCSFVNPKTRRVVTVPDCKHLGSFVGSIRTAMMLARSEGDWDGKVGAKGEAVYRVTVHVDIRRPKSHFSTGHLGTGEFGGKLRRLAPGSRFCHVKPDVDKVLRAVLDSLTGVVYSDDSQVIAATPTKRWSDRDWTTITIEEFTWESMRDSPPPETEKG